jgi:hypothetical protein
MLIPKAFEEILTADYADGLIRRSLRKLTAGLLADRAGRGRPPVGLAGILPATFSPDHIVDVERSVARRLDGVSSYRIRPRRIAGRATLCGADLESLRGNVPVGR